MRYSRGTVRSICDGGRSSSVVTFLSVSGVDGNQNHGDVVIGLSSSDINGGGGGFG